MISQSFLAIIPPIIVIIIAICTRRVRLALISGIASASIIATQYSSIKAIKLILQTLYKVTIGDPSHLYTFFFLILLGILIRLITHSGGIAAYTQKILKYLTSIKLVQSTTLLVSFLFPLDEYLSNLTVGCIMNPLFDKFNTNRAKLAYLLNATAAPLCVLIPLSSWTALLISLFEASGINISTNAAIQHSAFSLYIKTIPFMLYPILSIIAAWTIIQCALSYGPMKKIEHTNTQQTAKDCASQCKQSIGSITSFFLPMIVFISSLLILLVYTGIRAAQATGTLDVITVLQNMKPLISLFSASLIACIVTSIYLRSHAIMTIKTISHQALCGLCEMLAPISVLLLAWIFSDIINVQLHTGDFVATALLKGLPLFLIPVILFLIALVISASTGTSWGTLMILTPLAIPLVIQTAHIAHIATIQTLLLPALGSIISGSIAGGHLSPFHDLVILASTSTKIDPLIHIKTMVPYVSAPIIGSLAGFLCAGYLALHAISTPHICIITIAIGLLVTSGLLALFNKIL